MLSNDINVVFNKFTSALASASQIISYLGPQNVIPVASPHTKLTESVNCVILNILSIIGSSPRSKSKFYELLRIRLLGEIKSDELIIYS